jgi:hypothetical protein
VTGWWIHRMRDADVWVLLGVAALVAQLSLHHRLYDHLLVVVPMVTLLRLAWQRAGSGDANVLAGVLFTLTWFTMHAPATAFTAPWPLPLLAELAQAITWLAVLVFLIRQARG